MAFGAVARAAEAQDRPEELKLDRKLDLDGSPSQGTSEPSRPS
jgi:hypothetical protein